MSDEGEEGWVGMGGTRAGVPRALYQGSVRRERLRERDEQRHIVTAAAAEAAECARSGLSGRAWRAGQNAQLLEHEQRAERWAAEHGAMCDTSDYESD